VLFTFEELPIEEIAKITGVDPGAVKSRLHRARQALRAALATLLTSNPDGRFL
jgi:DNA-directed RNA polymerase specialized sigma24 family protein